MAAFLDDVSQVLSRFARPSIRLLWKTHSSFWVLGATGFVLAVCLGVTLGRSAGRTAWPILAVAAGAAGTFLALVAAAKAITGEERLTFYHHQIAVLIVAWVILRLADLPILPYLDITILGIGLFAAIGRVGCLMVGCCYGRPHRWGVRYGSDHADLGFPAPLVGVPLFPVQIAESLALVGIVAAGAVLITGSAPPGSALEWFIVSYAGVRFGLEFLRGDPGRPFVLGFSEAQWTSVLLLSSVVAAESIGLLPRQNWHAVACASLLMTLVLVALGRHLWRPWSHVLRPLHLVEVAQAVVMLREGETKDSWSTRSTLGRNIDVATTPMGIQISAGDIRARGVTIHHFAVSTRRGPMPRSEAGALARVIATLIEAGASYELVGGHRGVFHFIMPHSE